MLVVDDQAPFRHAAKAVLRRLDGFELVGEASSGSEAIALADELQPALVLMDINMPGMTGIEATKRIVAAHPDVVIFLCSTYDAADLPSSAGERGQRLCQQGTFRRADAGTAVAGPGLGDVRFAVRPGRRRAKSRAGAAARGGGAVRFPAARSR